MMMMTRRQKQEIDDSISKVLKSDLAGEQNYRESTITIRKNDYFNHVEILFLIREAWIKGRKQYQVVSYQRGSFVYVRFKNGDQKKEFMESIEVYVPKLAELILAPNQYGHHFSRKDIKLALLNVDTSIKAYDINCYLQEDLSYEYSNVKISVLEEGGYTSGEGKVKCRNLTFKVNSVGFELIFGKLGAKIPYIKEGSGRAECYLSPKIMAKPWMCQDCWSIGSKEHECRGKICKECGESEHGSKSCKSRRCINCRVKGHSCYDKNCPKFIEAIVRELYKVEIPLIYISDSDKRKQLVNAVHFK